MVEIIVMFLDIKTEIIKIKYLKVKICDAIIFMWYKILLKK